MKRTIKVYRSDTESDPKSYPFNNVPSYHKIVNYKDNYENSVNRPNDQKSSGRPQVHSEKF